MLFGVTRFGRRKMYESHGWPDILGATIMSIVMIGGLIVLACTTWAWAVHVQIIHGTMVGAILGGLLGLLVGMTAGSQRSRQRRRNVFGGAFIGIGLPMIPLTAFSAVVGVFTH